MASLGKLRVAASNTCTDGGKHGTSWAFEGKLPGTALLAALCRGRRRRKASGQVCELCQALPHPLLLPLPQCAACTALLVKLPHDTARRHRAASPTLWQTAGPAASTPCLPAWPPMAICWQRGRRMPLEGGVM